MKTPVIHRPLQVTELKDWGVIPTMLEGESHVSGVVLHKGPEASPNAASGIARRASGSAT